jgi:hypothetical protein
VIYKISDRVIAPTADDDSFWLQIPGATTQTVNHSSGWVQWNNIAGGADWHWDIVHSADDGNTEVEWTMAAGTYTLEIAYREDDTLLDAITIAMINETSLIFKGGLLCAENCIFLFVLFFY